nr:MAG TPA: hypothetical protein [Caudoviricetes sp.]
MSVIYFLIVAQIKMDCKYFLNKIFSTNKIIKV